MKLTNETDINCDIISAIKESVATPHLRHCTEALQSNLLLLFPGVPSQTVHVEKVLQLSIYESILIFLKLAKVSYTLKPKL